MQSSAEENQLCESVHAAMYLQSQILIDVLRGKTSQLISGFSEVVEICFAVLSDIAKCELEQKVPAIAFAVTITHGANATSIRARQHHVLR